MEDELSKYIKEAQGKGISPADIRKNLISAGWDPTVINKLELPENMDPTKTIFNNGTQQSSGPIKPEITKKDSVLPSNNNATVTSGSTNNQSTLNAATQTTPWYKNVKLILLSLAGLVSLLVITSGVLAYLYYGLGKTIFGHNFFEQKWQQFVNNANGELAERNFSVTYQDNGQFKFVPSQLIKDINLKKVSERYTPEEQAFYDKLLSFSIKDPKLNINLNQFLNVTDIEKPKIDDSIKLDYTNDGTTYTIQDMVRLIDLNGYNSLYLSDTLRNYIKDKIDISATQYPEYKKEADLAKKKIDEWNSKWFRYEFDKDTIKYLGKNLNDTSNWQFIGSMEERDYQRASKATSIADQAFEYYKQNQKWPAKISDLKNPPSAPTPADGKCTEEGNKYNIFTRGDSLLISYCLGKDATEPNYYGSGDSKSKAGMNVVVIKKPSSTSRYEQYVYNLSYEAYNCPPERKCLLDTAQPEANPFKDILRNNRPFDIQSFHGISKMDNEWTAHYTLKLDKNKLRNIFLSVEKQSVGENEYNSNDDYAKQRREAFETRLDWWLNNQNISNFDVWFGLKSGRLYKVSWDQHMPSAVTTANWAYKSLTSGALKQYNFPSEISFEKFTPDQRRLIDIGSMLETVNYFKSTYGGYPAGKNGQPDGGSYFNNSPVSPVVPPDGKCTDFYNTYWYSPQGTPFIGDSYYYKKDNQLVYPDFSLTFCLGFKTLVSSDLYYYDYNTSWAKIDGWLQNRIFDPGIYKVTSQGISQYSCPVGKTCYKEVSSPKPITPPIEGQDFSTMLSDELIKYIEKEYMALPWDATLHVTYTANNFGKDQNIETPKDSKTFDQAEQEIAAEATGDPNAQTPNGRARDARRVADISQIRTALELYLNDKGEYPKNVNDLVPNYIYPFPDAPKPADGKCSEAQNTYTYHYDKSGLYSLTFCLGGDTGSYQAGERTLTPQGIQ